MKSRLVLKVPVSALTVLLGLCFILAMPWSSAASSNIELTDSEQAWIKDHPVIRTRISPDYPPFESYIDNSFQGMTYDYLQLIAGRLGIRFEPIRNMTWKDSLESIKSRSGVDLIPLITRDKSRDEFIAFTNDYISFPGVIVSRKDGRFISGIKDLDGLTIASESFFIGTDWIRRDIPQARILETVSTEAALESVATGKADVYIGNLAVAGYLIEKNGLTDLKIAAPSPYEDDAYAMGVRKDWPELAAIINKTIASITEEEHRQIRQKWLSVRYEHGLQAHDIIKWVAIVAGILIVFIIQLRRMVKQRTAELQSSLNKLEDAHRQLEDIIEFLPDATLVLDCQGRVLAWNRAIEEMTGVSKTEMIGKGEQAYAIPFYGVTRPVLADILLHGKDPEPGQYDKFRRQGKILAAAGPAPSLYDGLGAYLSVTASPLTDRDGNLIGAIESLRDITALRAAEAEVLALNEQLESRVQHRTAELELAKTDLRRMNDDLSAHAHALEEANRKLEAFSYSVSHDLQAPLRHIRSYADLIVEDHVGQLDSQCRHYLDRIIYSCDHLNTMITAMLDFALSSNQEICRIDIDTNRLVREVISELQKDTVVFDIKSLPSCQADPILLRQVYANLIGNALKFSRTKGSDALIEVGSKISGNKTVYFVRDNGIGFDMAYADKLFGVFQRLESTSDFEGIGIGLAIAQNIIKRHGGTIWAEGTQGEGASFYFTLD